MTRVSRGAFIVWVVFRYGLDELVLASFQKPWLRIVTRVLTVGRNLTAPRGQRLREALERLGGRYITAEDVGTSPADMAFVAKKTSYVAGLGASGDPSPFTALGCFVGAQAAIKHHLQRDSFEGLTVAVQGLGHVGYDYARRLHAAGAKLVVADIDTAALERARTELGATVVAPHAIYDAEADIYATCALGATLNP